MQVPEFLTVQEVAVPLRVSPAVVRQLVRDKKITGIRIGRSIRIDAASVGRYLARTATGTRAAA
jgi:excisionase family DNA binding protein